MSLWKPPPSRPSSNATSVSCGNFTAKIKRTRVERWCHQAHHKIQLKAMIIMAASEHTIPLGFRSNIIKVSTCGVDRGTVMQTTTAAVAEHKRERFLLCINHRLKSITSELVDVRVDSFGAYSFGRWCTFIVVALLSCVHCHLPIIVSFYHRTTAIHRDDVYLTRSTGV